MAFIGGKISFMFHVHHLVSVLMFYGVSDDAILAIPDICHGRTDDVRVNFFWPVKIFTDLTRKIGNLLCILQ